MSLDTRIKDFCLDSRKFYLLIPPLFLKDIWIDDPHYNIIIPTLILYTGGEGVSLPVKSLSVCGDS